MGGGGRRGLFMLMSSSLSRTVICGESRSSADYDEYLNNISDEGFQNEKCFASVTEFGSVTTANAIHVTMEHKSVMYQRH
jgi:hypothetical protein